MHTHICTYIKISNDMEYKLKTFNGIFIMKKQKGESYDK